MPLFLLRRNKIKIVSPQTVVDSTLISSNVNATSAASWSAGAVYKLGDVVQRDITNSHHTYESKVGVQSTVTLTIASPCVVTFTGHGQIDGTPVSFTSTGTLPTGITAGTVYFVRNPTANSFNISAAVGGAAINTTGTQSGVHTATSSTNFNKDPSLAANSTFWLDTGSTNRWKMFDQGVQTQTSNADKIEVVLQLVNYIDTVAILNAAATTIRVQLAVPGEGLVYDKTQTLTSTDGVIDWYSYFFTPIRRRTDVLFTDIPSYGNAQMQITMSAIGQTVKCGACLFGKSEDISFLTGKGTAAGAKLGIQDYSIKSVDSFGNYTIVERAFNRRADFTVMVENKNVDYIINLLSSRRAQPTLYIGSSKFSSSIVYGFYKDFDIDIAYADHSICSIQLEGLT